MNIFTFWTGKKPNLLNLIEKINKLHLGNNLIIIDDDNLYDYLDSKEINPVYNKLNPPQKADYLRILLVYKYGGIWIDFDTLIIEDLEYYFNLLDQFDGFFVYNHGWNNNKAITNCFFGSKPKTLLFKNLVDDINKVLDEKKEKISWSEIGSLVLLNLLNNNKNLFDTYYFIEGKDTIYPVNYDMISNIYLSHNKEDYIKVKRNNQHLLFLVNSFYNHNYFSKKSEVEIYHEDNVFNIFMNTSLKNLNITEDIFIKYLLNDLYYNEIINSNDFQKKIKILNGRIVERLVFSTEQISELYEEKRRRICLVARMSKNMFEIGFNGGHSSFLCLMFNNDLDIVTNDIVEYYPPIKEYHPEFYVEEGYNVLKTLFPDRIRLIIGDCLKIIPEYAEKYKNIEFDMIHIDGPKETYYDNFKNLLCIMKNNAYVIFNDSNIQCVKNDIDNLKKEGLIRNDIMFPEMNKKNPSRNSIFRVTRNSEKIKESNFLSAKLYIEKARKNNNIETLCGPGSYKKNTKEIVKFINDAIKKYNISSILDLGCGDFNWFQNINLENIRYIGFDCDELMIKSNNEKYKGDFYVKDIISEDYPNVDLIICRDVLFHIQKTMSIKIIKKIKNKCKYFLSTSFLHEQKNEDIKSYNDIPGWGFYKINLNIDPFDLSKNMIDHIEENNNFSGESKRYVCIYKI